VFVAEAPPITGSCPPTTGPDDPHRNYEEQLALVYRLHGRPLYRFLVRLSLGDRRAAEDLLQETMLRAWRLVQANPVDAENLRPLLFTIARRLSIDAFRARRARPSEVCIDSVAALPSPCDDVEQTVVALTIRHGLMSLSPDHRRVLIEIFYHGRRLHEVAETLGIPEGTVKSRMFYGLRSLGVILSECVDRPLGGGRRRRA
jgi:RNA polymerase sigma-70 factor, ECF subfamily